MDVWVRVYDVRVVQHAEGDVARAACDVEDALRRRRDAGGVTWVKRGDEVVPVLLRRVVSYVVPGTGLRIKK